MATNGQVIHMPAIAHGNGMRILFLAPFAAGGPKGTTRWRLLPLARALAAQGHTVRVLIPPYDCPRQSGSNWRDQGVQVDNLDLPPLHGSLSQLALARKMAQVAFTWQPDVVHCFKPKGPAGLAAWILDRKPGWRVPLVMDADDWEIGWNPIAGLSASLAEVFSLAGALGAAPGGRGDGSQPLAGELCQRVA